MDLVLSPRIDQVKSVIHLVADFPEEYREQAAILAAVSAGSASGRAVAMILESVESEEAIRKIAHFGNFLMTDASLDLTLAEASKIVAEKQS